MNTVLRVICAYCGRFIREKDGDGVEGESHGICPECARWHGIELEEERMSEANSEIKRLIDLLDQAGYEVRKIDSAQEPSRWTFIDLTIVKKSR